MKTFLVQCIVICFFSSTVFAQSNCSKFYPFSEGAVTELTMYDKKGKVAGIVQHAVKGVSSTGTTDVATMTQILKDKKGEEITTSEYDISCTDGLVSIDFKSLSRSEMLKAMGDFETEITGTNLDLPNDLSVGQSLPDAGVNIKINMSGINMNMDTTITERQVVGQESITTPAGTFECYVMTSTITFKMGMSKSKQWIAEGVGVVKTEDYNKKGKLQGSSLLTAFSN
ncbi:MAG: hypothetical protein AAF489_05090 [Bacteroidota bacterium]